MLANRRSLEAETNQDENDSQLSRYVTRAYMAALAGLSVLAMVGFVILEDLAVKQEEHISAVDIGTRQRILTERTIYLAQQAIDDLNAQDRSPVLSELARTRDQLLAAHTAMTTSDDQRNLPRSLSEAMRELYFEEPWRIDAKVRHHVALLDRFMAILPENPVVAGQVFAQMRDNAETDLFGSLELLAAQYDREAEASLAATRRGHLLVLAATLIALLVVAVFIFRPLTRTIVRRTSELMEAKAEVEHASLHDTLTNLPNRRQCARELEKAIASARRGGRRVAILHIDLDRFKQINDTFGHAVGDSVLVSAARRFERSVRRGDTIARVGGDEFVIIAPIETEPTEAARIAVRILTKMSRPIDCGAHTVTTAASIGISIFPDDETDPEQLLINADIALYRAKDRGRGRVSFFSPEMRREFEDRERLEQDLRRAIAQDEFAVHFQPQVRDDTDQVVGMEALVRWQHPEKGLVSADRFMQIAHSSGLILPIGRKVIDQAFAAAGEWRKKGFEFGVVSINVSASQLKEERFVDFVKDRMSEYELDPSFVAIEFMESVLTDKRNDSVGPVIEELQDLGVTIELDDFGTGYAALSHLKRFNIGRLKIDRTFVGAIGKETQNINLIKTLVDVARNFEIDVLAEGVENEAQRSFLNAIGCMQVQGYDIARPMSGDAAASWLAAREDLPGRVDISLVK